MGPELNFRISEGSFSQRIKVGCYYGTKDAITSERCQCGMVTIEATLFGMPITGSKLCVGVYLVLHA